MDISNFDDIVFPLDPLARIQRLEDKVAHLEDAIAKLQRVADRVQLDDVSGKWITVTERKHYGSE